MLLRNRIDDQVTYATFEGSAGVTEYYLAVHSREDHPFPEAVADVHARYHQALDALGLSGETQMFSRVFLSDIANQTDELSRSELFGFIRDGAYSVIQQCPLNSGDVSLFAYHFKKQSGVFQKVSFAFDNEQWRNGARVIGDHHDMYWTGNFSGLGQSDSFEQTKEIFTFFNNFINENGLTLLNNTVRTWLYVRDVDNNYHGMVDARKEYFYIQGLNLQTRYIASTGIEAKMKEYYSLVSMDALSISGLKPGQIVRMEAPENLCPTEDYGVTFERGSKLVFGDRSHHYISGTASIDRLGQVLHPADVIKQTVRTLENIEALLRPHGAELKDMAYLIVYLRNIKDAERVRPALNALVSENMPLFLVQAPVCRPSWLIEIEGVAITPNAEASPYFI